MEKSAENAWILAIIGIIQLLPFTALAIIGIVAVVPPIVWVLGMVLFWFYLQHGRGKIQDILMIRRFWVASLIFNGIGLIVPGLFFYVIAALVFDLFTSDPDGTLGASYSWLFGIVQIVLLGSILTHVWLSYRSLKAIDHQISS
ncbi:MAG: hypothetical protein AAGD96_00170 [Chloroflexota bacterium]